MWVIGLILYIWLIDFVFSLFFKFSPINFVGQLFSLPLSLKEKMRLQELEKTEVDRKIKKLEDK